MVKVLKAAALIAAASGLAASASGQIVLYSQAPHTPGAAGGDGLSAFQGGLPTPPPMYDREIADDFTVPAAGWTISKVDGNFIQFTDGDPNPVTGADIQFYINNGGTVGPAVATATVINTTVTNGPGNYFGRTEKIVSFDVTPVVLAGGSYFVKINPIVNHNWFWLTSDPTTPISGSPAQNQRGPLTTPGTDGTWPATWQPTGPANPIFTTAHDEAFTLEGQIGGGGPVGACCITVSGACVITNTAGCASLGGIYRGDNTDCATANCPQPPMGACCLPNLTCQITYAAHCTMLNGTYQGDNSTCGSCPNAWQEQGDAGELPSTAQFCVGTGSLPGIVGTNDPSDTDMYAINITNSGGFMATTGNNGTAFDTMLFLFDSAGHGVVANDDAVGLQSTITSQYVPGNGLYYIAITQYRRVPQDASAQDIWSTFTPEMPPNGPGAANPVAGWAGSTGGGGSYLINLSGASYVDQATIGACCLTDGSCGLNTSAGCTAAGGIYRGNGSPCSTANCPQPPTGACCLPDGSCSVLTQQMCVNQNGTYRGDNSPCGSANCVPSIWNEQGDAGDLPSTAQVVNGPANTTLSRINGAVNGDADMYEIQICSPGNFSATTANAGTAFDTQLFLFDSSGHGVTSDDDDPQGTGGTLSRLSSQFIPGSGLYYLAISGYNFDPNGDQTGQLIWANTPFNVERRPDGPAASEAVGSWGGSGGSGNYQIDLTGTCFVSTGPTCYANCDASTTVPFLNVNDFICFQSRFAAGDSYANCDGSTQPPVLNVNDFICFQSQFAAGCSAP